MREARAETDTGTTVVKRWLSRFVHNVIAHPLLVLIPPLGEWLHERTQL